MFARIRNRVMEVVAPDMPELPSSYSYHHHHSNRSTKSQMPDKFTYARPPFLQLLTYDELKASADHNVRPIIVPRDISILPWNTGYAECVNSGKSEWNEDQAAFCRQVLTHPSKQHPHLPYTYFGIFDGHAGYGAALAASHQFHHILHEKLVDIIDMLVPQEDLVVRKPDFPHPILFQRSVSKDELIIGALESAFMDMDTLLAEDRSKYRNAGGCTALVTLFIFGKMFVSNAGDSRAVLCVQRISNEVLKNENSKLDDQKPDTKENLEDKKITHIFPIPFSHDHTPDTERPRLMSTAKLNPVLMGGEYVAMEYAKRPIVKDLGQRILYRQGTMKGWTYKTLTHDDLKMPIVTGEGKRSRLMGTIGVTRGFGDHDLKALGSGLPIKPFLSPHPEVIFRDLTKVISIPEQQNQDGDFGILVMATDGLWDVADTESVSMTVFNTLSKYSTEKHRYTMVAQELVAKSRGRINDSGHWRLADSKAAATVDDISVICIPVYQYYLEYLEWEKQCEKNSLQKFDQIEKELEIFHSINGETVGTSSNDNNDNDGDDEQDDDDDDEVEEAKDLTINSTEEVAEIAEIRDTNIDGAESSIFNSLDKSDTNESTKTNSS